MSALASPPTQTAGTRARPLSVEERQASIIDAVIPLLAVHGRDISSKQIAEAAGVAEGTVFRAFGDKESIIAAAIVKFLDPEPLAREIRAIDTSLDLDAKILAVIRLLQQRFGDVFRVMAIVGHERNAHPETRRVVAESISDVLAPEQHRLNWSASRSAHIIRLVTFASSFPHLSDDDEFTTEELAAFVLHGLSPQHAAASEHAQHNRNHEPAERLN